MDVAAPNSFSAARASPTHLDDKSGALHAKVQAGNAAARTWGIITTGGGGALAGGGAIGLAAFPGDDEKKTATKV